MSLSEYIALVDWVALMDEEQKYFAYVGEHETVTRQFLLADLAYRDYTFYLDMAFDLASVTTEEEPREIAIGSESIDEHVQADGVSVIMTTNSNTSRYTQRVVRVDCSEPMDVAPLTKLVRTDGILLTWTVLAQQTQLPGTLHATLRAVGPQGEVKKSAVMAFEVLPAVEAVPAKPVSLTEHEQMERAMVLALEQASQDVLSEWRAFADGEYASAEDVRAAQSQANMYTDECTMPAQIMSGKVGTVKLKSPVYSGLTLSEDGYLELSAATEEQIRNRGAYAHMPIVTGNLDCAVKAVGDGYYATGEEVAAAVAGVTVPPAIADGTPGTVKLAQPYSCGLEIGADGILRVCPATEAEIDMRLHGYLPITPYTLDYAVKSVGDGYYATQDYVNEAVAGAGGDVDLTGYVKNTEYAGNNKAGIVVLDAYSYMSQNRESGQGLRLKGASEAVIRDKPYGCQYAPITANNYTIAVKYGLIQNNIVLTVEEQAAAQAWLGVTEIISALSARVAALEAAANG